MLNRFTHTHTHIETASLFPLPHTHTHTHTYTFMLGSHIASLTHTHTHSLSHTHTHTLSLTHTSTNTHARVLRLFYGVCVFKRIDWGGCWAWEMYCLAGRLNSWMSFSKCDCTAPVTHINCSPLCPTHFHGNRYEPVAGRLLQRCFVDCACLCRCVILTHSFMSHSLYPPLCIHEF